MNRLILLSGLLLAPPLWGAVTFDAVGTGKDTGASGVVTSSFTTLTVGSGSERALIAQVCWTGVPTNINNVGWDTAGTRQAMTLISSGTSASSGHTCAIYGLVAPTSGNKTWNATWTGSQECITQLVSWTSVDQTGGTTSFIRAPNGTGNSNTATVTVPSAVGNATVSAISAGAVATLNSVSATSTFLINGAGSIEGGGSRAAGSASNAMTGAYSTTDQWIAVGVNIVASAAAASAPSISKQDKLMKLEAL